MDKSKAIRTKEKRFISTMEMGPLLGVSPRTIRNWINGGQIKGYKIGHSLKISKEEAVRILRRYEQSIPDEWQV